MVSDILHTVSFTLSDTDHVTYPEPDLIHALNNACRMVVVIRPDAKSTIGTVTLAEGVKQVLPDEAMRLLDTYYNENGFPIQMVNRKDLDRAHLDWMNMKPADKVYEVMYDERIPHAFYVYPPAQAGIRIELGYSLMPDVVTTSDDDFPLPEKYIPAVIEWMLYQLFAIDSTNPQAKQQAMAHSQQFYTVLQAKTRGDVMAAPDTSKSGIAE